MAKKLRKINTNSRKKKKIFIFLIILIALGVLGYFGYTKYFKNNNKQKVTVKILDSIDKYGYSIDDRDSNLYKEEFNKLKEILNAKEIDNKQYSEEVARLFVIDLYSINNKLNKYDIGGRSFYYTSKVGMYDNKVMDTLYATVVDDSYGDRKQELPEVKSVETISVKEDKYVFIENPVDNNCPDGYTKNNNNKCTKDEDLVYVIELKWDYVKDMGYDKEASIVVVPDINNKWSVAEYKPKLGAFE